jgi:DNA-directed RNA polymerase subunit alpha
VKISMSNHNITLPSAPRLVSEEGNKGVYEIDNLYPGYGHTLGNSIRRIVLSSLEGAAITSLKINGVSHEFSVIEGVKEDVINIILNLRKVRFQLLTDEPQTVSLNIKDAKQIFASDIDTGGQITVLNEDQYIAETTSGNVDLQIEMKIESGLGFLPKEVLQKDKVEIGHITVDAAFSPIRRVSYDVEEMRVGDKTNYNRLRISIETDGTYTPRQALEKSIEIMISQLQAIHHFEALDITPIKMAEIVEKEIQDSMDMNEEENKEEKKDDDDDTEVLKTRIEDLNLSTRTLNALANAKIRTVGGIARKKKDDLLELEGMGEKGIQEIKRSLSNFGILLK